MRHVALTGATGYVGSIIANGLPADVRLTRLVRRPSEPQDVAWSLDADDAALAATLAERGISDLVHAAWNMSASARDDVDRICVEGSLRLLRAARAAGVRRFIFISTISAFAGARSVYGRAKCRVEAAVLAEGGIVLRLGLVHGSRDGGMFGRVKGSVQASRFVPMIGMGTRPQYLLPAARLQAAIARALDGDLDRVQVQITLADSTPVAFRDLVERIAAEEGRSIVLVPLPWPLLWLGLLGLEQAGLAPTVRSDSVVSFVHADPAPDFSIARRLGI